MIKLYGTAMSRAGRSLWALEEVGIQYEQVLVAETRGPEYLKINPNGHVPTLDDNGTIIWESMAINLYVAEKYGKAPLWPSTVESHGACYQWSFWGMTEVEPHLLAMLMHKMLLPADQRDEKAAQKAAEAAAEKAAADKAAADKAAADKEAADKAAADKAAAGNAEAVKAETPDGDAAAAAKAPFAPAPAAPKSDELGANAPAPPMPPARPKARSTPGDPAPGGLY